MPSWLVNSGAGSAAARVPPPPRPGAPLSEPLLPESGSPANGGSRAGDWRGAAEPDRADGGASDDSFPPVREQAGQAAKVVALLVNSGIGTSTVAMPMAVRTLGAGLALGAMLLQATLGVLANHVLSKESARGGAGSYADLMTQRYGKWGGRGVAVAQLANSLGKSVVWLIILADLIVGSPGAGGGLLPELLRAGGSGGMAEGEHWYLRRWPWILLLAVMATPVVSVRSMSKLSAVSLVGDAAVALMAGSGLALAVFAAREGKAHKIHWLPNPEDARGGGSRAVLALELVSVFPVMMGAAFTQNQINSVMTELQPYSQSILDAAQAAARVLTLAVFLTIGASNNAVFGKELEPDVLLNYSALGLGALLPDRPALWLATAVRISFLVNGLVSLPMYLWPAQRNLWATLPNQDPEARMSERKSFATTNIAGLAGCAVVAVLVPSIWKPLKLLGGTAVSFMAFIGPGMVVLRRQSSIGRGTGAGGKPRWRSAGLTALGWVLVVVGLAQAAASVASQFI
ncbi:putative sodium-coupled neutral amino acid transporter 6 [Micractinium conductrix]|uniref:Sodium-coupled neutral amino acid transporter 6 n=1 Tax=Micractinium conductrix TaxID=554055 RepID=A0A2P6VQB5_9CHLO|nr:putative sodium-coupled neutral amino acid transporter 6 [Micractinium conductrix]|eukprot:PSC76288.1 putative sodium-coupled neutral amino acid transporter 6 [Micractinium conductrix]